MATYNKPKRKPITNDDARRNEFYRMLFVALLIPSIIVATILLIPSFIINNLPDRLSASCVASQSNIHIRIESETVTRNQTQYLWSNDDGETWREVLFVARDYTRAIADCSTVKFFDDHTRILVDTPVLITQDGTVYDLSHCDVPTTTMWETCVTEEENL